MLYMLFTPVQRKGMTVLLGMQFMDKVELPETSEV